MGIDYLVCDCCGEGFPDVIDYSCCECGKYYCSDECAEEKGFIEECVDENGEWFDSSCDYCRGEDYTDSILLEYALELLGVSREELVKENKKREKGNENE